MDQHPLPNFRGEGRPLDQGGRLKATRDTLPTRRAQETFDLDFEGFRYSVSASRYADRGVGEVFIQDHKTTTPVEAIARDAAILISIALQYGVTAERLRSAVTRDGRGGPATIVGAVLDMMEEA